MSRGHRITFQSAIVDLHPQCVMPPFLPRQKWLGSLQLSGFGSSIHLENIRRVRSCKMSNSLVWLQSELGFLLIKMIHSTDAVVHHP